VSVNALAHLITKEEWGMTQPKNVGRTQASGYKPLSVKASLRKILSDDARSRTALPGIFGFEETVIPQVQMLPGRTRLIS